MEKGKKKKTKRRWVSIILKTQTKAEKATKPTLKNITENSRKS